MARFTILLPVVRPPLLLPLAIETVLAQTVNDFELFVVCDGAPQDTVDCASDFARRDPRIRVFAFGKGERHGEAHRHTALLSASGQYVAHICDDDLWLPNHLHEMEMLLREADFGHSLHVFVHRDGRVDAFASDLAKPDYRQRFLADAFNRFGPTFCGYRLAAYRNLPEGWAPAPPSVWTDLHMWRKFFGDERLRFDTRMAITAIHFATREREDMPLPDRAQENALWLARTRDPVQRDGIVQAAWKSIVDLTL